MKKLAITAALLAAFAAPAYAQDEEASSPFAYSIAVVSDYAFRGISQTNEGPAFQASAAYNHDSGFYAGVWASNVDFADDDGANWEIDTYIGYATDITDGLGFDVQLLRYNYPGDSYGDYTYNELVASVSFGSYFKGTIGYSNDVFNSDETGIYYGLSAAYPLEYAELTLNGSLGRYDLEDALGDSYNDFSIGLSKPFGPMAVGVSYVYASDDVASFGRNDGARYLLTTNWAF